MSKECLNMTPNSLAIKAKIDKQDDRKLKRFYTAKKTTSRVKLRSTEWGGYLQTLSKELTFKMHKAFNKSIAKTNPAIRLKMG